jgi:hypothetical protein
MEQPLEIHMSELIQSENGSLFSMQSLQVPGTGSQANEESEAEEVSEEIEFEDAS